MPDKLHPMLGPRHRPHLRRATLLTFALALAAAVALLAPLAAGAAPAASALSPRLVVLSSPRVRSLPPARQARRVSLSPDGPGSLLRHGRRVVVDVHFSGSAEGGLEALRDAGAGIVTVSPRYDTVTVAALPAQLPGVAAVPGVIAVSEEITPFTSDTCPQGRVVSEGDSQLEAAAARSAFGVDGSGVTVGILSDSFNQWTGAPTSEHADVVSGDLPGPDNPCGQKRPVNVLEPFIPGAAASEGGEEENEEEETGPEDEGRAMAQIVHDLAPGADLDFASAFNGEFAFANAIRKLKNAGAQVIGDDVGYFDEPFFQDGPVAVAVSEVVAQGANYFSAAGNDNIINGEGEDIASWEAPAFRPMECPEGLPVYDETCMDFDPGPGEDAGMGITVEKEEPLYVDLQWAQPWNGVTTDLDMYLVKEGEIVTEAFNSANTEPGRQEPYEFIPWEEHFAAGTEEEEVELVIARCDVKCGEGRAEEEIEGEFPYAGTKGGDEGTPRLKVGLFENGGGVSEVEYPVSAGGDVVGPTVFGHAGAAAAIGVAAINVGTKEEPETYSSRGPVKHYFGPVVGTAPAPPIAEQVVAKPNLTASDCGSTTGFFGFEGGFHFCGTSAATPHAAAVAALIRSANPGVTNAQVRADLEGTATPIGYYGLPPFGYSAVGAGLVDADAAVAALALPPKVAITAPPAALGRDKRPAIAFAANRPARFACSLDGAPLATCESPFVPAAALADGSHGFVVTATDAAGRSGSATASFKIDTKAPKARIKKHPPKVVKAHKKRVKLSFRFAVDDAQATLQCEVDRGKFHKCGKNLARNFGRGPHAVSVRATDAAGNVGKPATFRFRVKPRR
jgi:subtilisin family serine protease